VQKLLRGIPDFPDRATGKRGSFRDPKDGKNWTNVLTGKAFAVDMSSWYQPFPRAINGLMRMMGLALFGEVAPVGKALSWSFCTVQAPTVEVGVWQMEFTFGFESEIFAWQRFLWWMIH
jgi:hypothetical protein